VLLLLLKEAISILVYSLRLHLNLCRLNRVHKCGDFNRLEDSRRNWPKIDLRLT
jgi:hypothetical protein